MNKEKKFVPRIDTKLKKRIVRVPEVIYKASGIIFMDKRIKSFLFTNDLSIICNTNAQAIMCVYPFTPQLSIINGILDVASVPVFPGVGGGTTTGFRTLNIAMQAELLGAFGVVVNAPMDNDTIEKLNQILDVPVIATVISENDDILGKVRAGAKILNVAGGLNTASLVRHCRELLGPKFPIIATGGHTDEHILETIEAGANAISYTPLSSSDIFKDVMDTYRKDKEK